MRLTICRSIVARLCRLVLVALATTLFANQAAAQKGSEVKVNTALPSLAAWTGDLDGMKSRRLVRILVPYSKTIYFIDKGEQLGTAAEFGQALDKWLNKANKNELERIRVAFIPTPRDQLLTALNEGRGDIAAGNLTITAQRLESVDFTKAAMSDVREILIAAPAAPQVSKLEDLGGKEVYVRKSSSYYEHLVALNSKFSARGLTAIKIVPTDEALEDEDLMEMVNAGLAPYVIVDNHLAGIWAKVFTSLKVHDEIFINEGGEIAWAIRKNSPLLKNELNAFVETHRVGTQFGSILRRRYYTDQKMLRRAYSPEDMKNFSELIEHFRRYSAEHSFDYLMITAQGYQESRLRQSERSKSGAVGVMQIKPSSAGQIGITGVDKSAQKNIEAGNKYLRYLITTYINDPELDDKNRTLFAFAAYNSGPGNLKKFRARAKEMGLNPNVWFGNVENAAAAIIGRETVQYVSNIYRYYIAYSMAQRGVVEKAEARKPAPAEK
jgi:membrane-bound lytic murein transglycosylase MltF